jgi:hypothetical protein
MMAKAKFESVHWMLLVAVFAVAPTAALARQNNAGQGQKQNTQQQAPNTAETQPTTKESSTQADESQVKTEAAQPQTEDEGKLTSVQGGKALGMSILGNQEAPKALVIVPWKGSELGNARDVSTKLDDSKLPIDKEVFMRMLSYYQIRSESRPGSALKNTNAAQPTTAANRRIQ